MKVRIFLAVAAVAALAAFGATAQGRAATGVSSFLAGITCASPGPVLSGEGIEEPGFNCEGIDSSNVLNAVPVCIAGTTYKYLDDQDEDFDYTAADFVSDLNSGKYGSFGNVASLGACNSTAVPPAPVGIFLCYSTSQSTPGVWPKPVADLLLKQGYWLPYAVPGDAAGGTNLGGFHLACNIAATQSVSDSFVGGDGTVLGPSYQGTTTGLYPKVGA